MARTKKAEVMTAMEVEDVDTSADFIDSDFGREDLNKLRDMVNKHETLLKA